MLASDQRYCLECGARRPALGSALAGDLRSLISLSSDESKPPARVESGSAPSVAELPRTSAASAVIAGVGVLLLAMGVGVLIGRAGSSAKAATQPAQVISVATPATGSGTSSASQAPAPSATKPSSKHASSKHGASKSSSSTSTEAPAGGVGQTPSKPAPPSVAEHLKGSKGGSYEQKSKNLPNVISTG